MQYRYRSPVLLGTWRETAESALADAIRANQARRGEDGTVIWLPGTVLEAASVEEAVKPVHERNRAA